MYIHTCMDICCNVCLAFSRLILRIQNPSETPVECTGLGSLFAVSPSMCTNRLSRLVRHKWRLWFCYDTLRISTSMLIIGIMNPIDPSCFHFHVFQILGENMLGQGGFEEFQPPTTALHWGPFKWQLVRVLDDLKKMAKECLNWKTVTLTQRNSAPSPGCSAAHCKNGYRCESLQALLQCNISFLEKMETT